MNRGRDLIIDLKGTKTAISINVCLSILLLLGVIICIILLALYGGILGKYKLGGDNCFDGNSCTRDMELEGGGCVYLPKPIGKSCSSQCYRPTSDLVCHYLQLTKGVLTPKCHSDTLEACKGTCSVDEDCTPLSTQDGELLGECKQNTCYYTRDITLTEEYDADEIPDLTCTSNAEVFNNYCEAYMNKTSPEVADSCITWDVQCKNAPLEQGGFALVPTCYYYYWCSVQAYVDVSPPILGRSISRNTEATPKILKASGSVKKSKPKSMKYGQSAPVANHKKRVAENMRSNSLNPAGGNKDNGMINPTKIVIKA
jgi:hypothetical protein